jgi:hypothetical protein
MVSKAHLSCAIVCADDLRRLQLATRKEAIHQQMMRPQPHFLYLPQNSQKQEAVWRIPAMAN